MKRPALVYFVATWCFLALAIQARSLSGIIPNLVAEGQSAETLRTGVFGVLFVLVSFHIIYLIQLRAFNRWFSICFFAWWTFTLIWNGVRIIPQLDQLRVLMIPGALVVLNLLSIWYLIRRKFREFAVQFVAERDRYPHSRAMQKAVRKNMEKDIASMRS
jgi:hypothetical protein